MKKIFVHEFILSKINIFSIKLRYNLTMKVYIIWLLGVIAWNYLVPNATPIEDVIVAVLLSFLSIGLKKVSK
ncbi:hypothetical protein OAX35_01100 [Candidatus Pelagibacter ubique]|nr:hypothetical protein [Candidatus Pelagibacter ubique]